MTFPLMPNPISLPSPKQVYQTTLSQVAIAASYTFSAVPIGVAAGNRYIVVAVQTSTTGALPTTLTINGVAATLLVNSVGTSFYGLYVPTGTTATIVTNWSPSPERVVLTVWSVTGITRPIPQNTGAASGTSATASLTLDVAKESCLLAVTVYVGGTDMTWSGADLVERADVVTAGVSSRFTQADSRPSANGSLTITCAGTAGSQNWRIVAVTLR